MLRLAKSHHPSLDRRAALVAATLLVLGAAAAPLAAQVTSLPDQPARATVAMADPWLATPFNRTQRRTVDANIARIDRALEPYRIVYRTLDADARTLLRGAFTDLVPGARFASYRVNEAQAKAIVFLAFGPVPVESDCGPTPHPGQGWEPRRERRDSRCAARLDSLSRDAAWIHTAVMALGRTGGTRPRDEERATMRDITERARNILISAGGCGCEEVRVEADSLYLNARAANDALQSSNMPAWMVIGGQQADRIARLADEVEQELIDCLSGRRR